MPKRTIKSVILIFVFIFLLFLPIKFVFASNTDLQKQIDELKQSIDELEKQQKIYEDNINLKHKQAISLKNEISILDNQINKANTNIKKKEKEIKITNLEINQIQDKIQNKNIEIKDLEIKISGFLKQIYQDGNKDYFHIIFINEKISDYFSMMRAELDIQSALQKTHEDLQSAKTNLERQQQALAEKKSELEQLKKELNDTKNELEQNKKAKNYLLTQTQGAEWKFQNLLAQAKAEILNAEKEVSRLEKTLREKLAQEEQWRQLEASGAVVFAWPVSNLGVTTLFHDPEYPFRTTLGEHPAIDVRSKQGTQIRAPASGYVGRAKNGGMGYSYVMLVHQQGFSTIYGHVSKILVAEGTYVKRGDIIALSGGMPGTPGAGQFSTGPHLHFEIRKDGIPVNPLSYLP